MQKIFNEVGSLDKRCYDQYALNEDILMEHAADAMAQFIQDVFEPTAKILIVCGSGNNGGDGIAAARLLQGKYNLNLFIPFGAKSQISRLQLKRAELTGVEISNSYNLLEDSYDLVVDCLFGTGLNRELDKNCIKIIEHMNSMEGYKLSCDIPSGIDNEGRIKEYAFKAEATITMGALKKSLIQTSKGPCWPGHHRKSRYPKGAL